tara:strand:+ start:2967 stop:3164 length:198 start_codon:yes stop_codon:yes gene_type:complete
MVAYSSKEKAYSSEEKTEIIMQLWYCLQNGYSYDEAKIHMQAFQNGKTTVIERQVKVIETRGRYA